MLTIFLRRGNLDPKLWPFLDPQIYVVDKERGLCTAGSFVYCYFFFSFSELERQGVVPLVDLTSF